MRKELLDTRLTLEEITLIDNTLPRALPKLINREWSTKESADHYKAKLAEAGELQQLIDKIHNDNSFNEKLHSTDINNISI